MKRAKKILLVLAVLALAACSAPGGRASAPSTTRWPATGLTAHLPACAPVAPNGAAAAPVKDPPPRLIWIDPTELRVCAYAGGYDEPRALVAQGDASSQAQIDALVRAANGFHGPPTGRLAVCNAKLTTGPERVLVATFAAPGQWVQVRLSDHSCPDLMASNGHNSVFATATWFDALDRVAHP